MSRGTASNFQHIYLAQLMKGPVLQHELGAGHLVPDRIRQLEMRLPIGWEIVARWVRVPTRFGTIRERQYELKRPVWTTTAHA